NAPKPGRPPGRLACSGALGHSHQISSPSAAITRKMSSQRRLDRAGDVCASDMNWVRLERSVNLKQSEPSRKGDLLHFYVLEHLGDGRNGRNQAASGQSIHRLLMWSIETRLTAQRAMLKPPLHRSFYWACKSSTDAVRAVQDQGMNASLIILALIGASFLLGFLRDLFIAKAFGLSWEADLIFVALILPMFFENFFGLALRDAMIPYLQKLRSQSDALFASVARMLYWRIMVFGVMISVLVIASSYWMLKMLAPGWTDVQISSGQLVFCVGALLVAVQAVLYCQAALLNMDNIFILPMTRTVLLNTGAIIGILLFEPTGMVIFFGMLLPQLALIVVQHRRIGYLHGTVDASSQG